MRCRCVWSELWWGTAPWLAGVRVWLICNRGLIFNTGYVNTDTKTEKNRNTGVMWHIAFSIISWFLTPRDYQSLFWISSSHSLIIFSCPSVNNQEQNKLWLPGNFGNQLNSLFFVCEFKTKIKKQKMTRNVIVLPFSWTFKSYKYNLAQWKLLFQKTVRQFKA